MPLIMMSGDTHEADVRSYDTMIFRGDDMAESYEELHQMSTEDVIQAHDLYAPQVVPHLDYYCNELTRREIQAHSQQMLSMTADMRRWTKVMLGLTIIIAVLTAVNVAILLIAAS
jgi:hypothetical protein